MSYANRISFGWSETFCDGEDIVRRAQLPTGWTVTVLDRMTGYGHRDIETGLRCHGTGRFWLASGNFDVRDYLRSVDSEDELITLIQRHANTCRGEADGRYPHFTHEQLMRRYGVQT